VGTRFDAVVFDAGGVLVVPTPEVISPVITAFGGDGSVDAVVRAHYRAMYAQDAHSLADQDWSVYQRAFVTAVGITEPPAHEQALAAFREVMNSGIDVWRWPLASSVAALRSLNEAGIPIAVVSNAEGQIAATLEREGVCQVGPGAGAEVAVVVDSHVVGVSKPDPSIFGFALEVLGLEPARVLYVGDSIAKDVVGARAAGLHPLHLDPFDDHRTAGHDHDRIRTLSELLDWVS
jgi:putative hydrolase of the HAD superfamily